MFKNSFLDSILNNASLFKNCLTFQHVDTELTTNYCLYLTIA